MRRTMVGVAVIVAAAVAALWSTGPASATRRETVDVVGRSIGEEFVDSGAAGPSPGDSFTVSYDFFDALDDTRRVGSGYIACTMTHRAPLCVATHRLDGRGDIQIQSLNEAPNRVVAAIVGGSGEFVGAGGEAWVDFPNGLPGTVIEVRHHLVWANGSPR